MKYEFGFRENRNKLAKALRNLRKDGATEKAKDVLRKEKDTPEYKIANALHAFGRSIPRSSIDARIMLPEIKDDPELWDVVDVRHLITPQIQAQIDAEVLLEAHQDADPGRANRPNSFKSAILHMNDPVYAEYFGLNRKHSPENTKEMIRRHGKFLDSITDGRFLSPRNFTHVVGALPGLKEQFDRYSTIELSDDWGGMERDVSGEGVFWVMPRGNDYIPLLSRPIVICSPNNPGARRFVALARSSNPEFITKPFLKGVFLGDPKKRVTQGGMYWGEKDLQLIFNKDEFAKEKFTWMDIADCIVDLKAGKVWKRKYPDL